MGTILVSELVSRATTLIQDATNTRWPSSEILDWYDDFEREAVRLLPALGMVNVPTLLTPGVTQQTVPAEALFLNGVTRNMGAAGTTPGDAVRLTSARELDSYVPNWHSATNSAGKIKHFIYDPANLRTFYVYPKAPATAWYIELEYPVLPDPVVRQGVAPNETTTATVRHDFTFVAGVNYVLFRMYSKDAEYASNAQLAVAYYQAFVQGVVGPTAQAPQE